MPATRRIRQLIGENAPLDALRSAMTEEGGTTLLDEGVMLAEEGKTSLEEVVRVAYFD